MLMRLLYVAAHMRTWYGKWGYGFGRAAFNHSREEYDRAMRAVHNAPLAGLLKDLEVSASKGSCAPTRTPGSRSRVILE